MSRRDCFLHLIALSQGSTPAQFLTPFDNGSYGSPPYLLKGKPHGWVHRPHKLNKKELLARNWDILIVTEKAALPKATHDLELIAAHLSVEIEIPETQYEQLKEQIGSVPKPMENTPSLPKEWHKPGGRAIPTDVIVDVVNSGGPLQPGELKLDTAMADFLSTALPDDVKTKPVSLMNLFKYPDGDSSTHDHYMEGFKGKFGDTAGASIKFMGPVKTALKFDAGPAEDTAPIDEKWDDANVVQYDSIWHYAYMLSTEIYQGLNQEKMQGLSDTCILCVSEVELAR